MPVHSIEVGHKAYIFTHTDHHKKPNELRERGGKECPEKRP